MTKERFFSELKRLERAQEWAAMARFGREHYEAVLSDCDFRELERMDVLLGHATDLAESCVLQAEGAGTRAVARRPD